MHVHLNHPELLAEIELRERSAQAEARVVDEHAWRHTRACEFVRDVTGRFPMAQVNRDLDDTNAVLRSNFARGLRKLVGMLCHDRQIVVIVRKQTAQLESDPAGPARDDRD
jgi:hypothetical protein